MIIKRNKDKFPPKKQEETPQPIVEESTVVEDDFADISFQERDERRRGDRRRGYRRIDDRKLISRAQEEAIMIKEQATKEAFEQGLKMAQTEVAKIKDLLLEFMKMREKVCEDLSNDILEISLEIAKKIIKQEITTNKEALKNMIINILNESAKNETGITLKIAEEDYETVKAFIPDILSNSQVEGKINLIQDKNIAQGGVIIVSSNGVIDASVDTQLGVLRELFRQI